MSGEQEEKKSVSKVKGRRHRISGFEEWGGYMASKKMKLAAQFAGQRDMEAEDQEETRTDIFKGVSIFVNGYTKPSADELRRLMMIHGGTYHQYLSSKTTHTIASNLPYSKIKNLKNQVVVTPDWIMDSISAGKLLSHQNYFLYTPEMTHKQPRLKLENFLESKMLEKDHKSAINYDKQSCAIDLLQDELSRDTLLSDEVFKNLPENYLNLQENDWLEKVDQCSLASTSGHAPTNFNFSLKSSHSSSTSTSGHTPTYINSPSNSDHGSSAFTSGNTLVNLNSPSKNDHSSSTLTSKHTFASINSPSKSDHNSSASTSGHTHAYVNLPSKSDHNSSAFTSEHNDTYINSPSKSDHSSTAFTSGHTHTYVNSPSKNDHCSTALTSSHNHSGINSIPKSEGPVTAGHPAFLSEFYSHSRLHHISTAGQELKRYVQSLVDNHNSKTFPGRENLKHLVKNGILPIIQNDHIPPPFGASSEKNNRVVMHLDMDCFFVSVGLRKHPELKGKPVAVTHSKGKRGGAQEGSNVHYEAAHYRNQSKTKLEGFTSSFEQNFCDEDPLEADFAEKPKISKYSDEYGSLSEIASCSYEARKAGIRNGMFLGEALRRCPNLKTISYDFEGYSEVSKQLYDIVASYTLDIEAISCDELYIDCTELLQDTGISPLQFASVLRAEIEEKTKCTASAGLGANMLLARLANRAAKPNGQYYVPNERIQEFMEKQSVRDLPGVGYSTSSKFELMGVFTCGDLQKLSLSKLQQEFGQKTGQTFYKRCRGKDSRTVQLQKERKSVSAEINYGIRFEREEDVFRFLKELSVEVVNRLNNINCKGKSITLKLMVRRPDAPVQTAKFMGHGVCDHIVKSVSLKSTTNDALIIGHECCMLARTLKIKPEDYRGVGIQLSKLEPVQKDTRSFRNIESFLSIDTVNGETENDNNNNREIFAPKELELAHKPLPKGGSIKDFLVDKSSPSKQPKQTSQFQPEPEPELEPPVLSVDQLDQSVLNALPEDLQKEVLEMYGTKTSTKSALSFQHSSSSSHSSSSKTHKNPSKKGSHVHQNKNKLQNKQNTLLDCMLPSKNMCGDDREEESVLRKKATIGGAENINEVRSLVKEWVLSSQVVLEEDIDQFRDYLLQVIDEDLKKVDLILKYFHRVVSTANMLWQQAYLTVLSYVQQKMLQKYGTMLDAKNEFST